jgi:hypothetical protein
MPSEAELSIVLKLKDEASSQLKNFSSQFKAMLPNIKTASLTMLAAGAAITGSLGVAIASAEAQRESQMKLAAVLKNVGVSYLEVKDSLEKTISTTQAKTAVSDEDQRNALAQLIITTGNYKLSLDAMPAVLDLAAAKSMTLESAAVLIARALNGDTTALNRYGIELDKNASQQEVLAAIMERVGGTAEDLASPLDKLKASLADLSDSIGTALLPTLDAILEKITPIIMAVIEWINQNRNWPLICSLQPPPSCGFDCVGFSGVSHHRYQHGG